MDTLDNEVLLILSDVQRSTRIRRNGINCLIAIDPSRYSDAIQKIWKRAQKMNGECKKDSGHFFYYK